ncbi:MAG: alpha/beta fold hydrolase [Candidatus Binataceae bacterium]
MANTEDIVGRYVKVRGTRTFFDEIGDGYPLICVHTAGSCSLEYSYILPLLAERGFHAYALDLPGRCRSSAVDNRPLRTIHEHAEFVYAFAETLALVKPVIMGCSIGGDLTLDYAAHHWPEMAAGIAMEGMARSPTFPSPSALAHPSWGPGWQDQMERAAIESLNRHCPAEKIAELRWMHRYAQMSAVGDLEGWASHDVRHLLGVVACPMLVIRGEDDFWVPRPLVDETVALLKNAEAAHLKNIGHYPMFEDPELIANMAADFCRRHAIL